MDNIAIRDGFYDDPSREVLAESGLSVAKPLHGKGLSNDNSPQQYCLTSNQFADSYEKISTIYMAKSYNKKKENVLIGQYQLA